MEKHNHIVFTFHQISFMLVIQHIYSHSGCLTNFLLQTSSVSPFWTFCARAPSGFENEWNLWECSVLRDVHIVLDMNKTYQKQRDYIFSLNLNVDLLTLAHENFYFSTLDLEKVQGKCLGCFGGTPPPGIVHPRYRELTQRGERAACEPRVADPWTRTNIWSDKGNMRGGPRTGIENRWLHWFSDKWRQKNFSTL